MLKEEVSISSITESLLGNVILPDSVDLDPKFEQWGLKTRSQGNRGTCSVFTVVGALEYAIASYENKGKFLSVEFLNWASHKVADRKVDGAFFSELWQGYLAYGICEESDLPYLNEFNPDLQPSEIAIEHAKQLLHSIPLKLHWIKEWDVTTGLTDASFLEIKRTLANQFPVCGGFRWPKETNWKDEILQMCSSSEVFDGHSVILSGYKDDPSQPGNGIFIIRNSGGKNRRGYIPYEYAKNYMNDAAWIQLTKS